MSESRLNGRDFDGKVIESCTILTTEANALQNAIHNLMPNVPQTRVSGNADSVSAGL
jgi:putative SOS response-associated peptidase YedK